MTRSNTVSVLHRASERVSAGAAAIALTFLTLLTVDARADEPKETPTRVSVSYSDMAFASTEGAAQVYRKLKAAARTVCGVGDGHQSLASAMAAHECYEGALADAVRKIDRPLLTALHVGSGRRFG